MSQKCEECGVVAQNVEPVLLHWSPHTLCPECTQQWVQRQVNEGLSKAEGRESFVEALVIEETSE